MQTQAKAAGALPVNIAWGLFFGGHADDASLFNSTSPFGAANAAFGATADNLKGSAGKQAHNQLQALLLRNEALGSDVLLLYIEWSVTSLVALQMLQLDNYNIGITLHVHSKLCLISCRITWSGTQNICRSISITMRLKR